MIEYILPYETRSLVREWLIQKKQLNKREKELATLIVADDPHGIMSLSNTIYELGVANMRVLMAKIREAMMDYTIDDSYRILDNMWAQFTCDDKGEIVDIGAFIKHDGN